MHHNLTLSIHKHFAIHFGVQNISSHVTLSITPWTIMRIDPRYKMVEVNLEKIRGVPHKITVPGKFIKESLIREG